MEVNKIAVVVDDHQLFADSFSLLLEKTKMFKEVHFRTDPEDFMRFLVENRREKICLFLDYYLKDTIGVEVIKDAQRINRKIQIVIVTTLTNPRTLQAIESFDPNAIISKSSGFDIILDCIQNLNNNQTYYCPVIAEILKNIPQYKTITFTSREIELLKCFSEGLSIIETAEKMYISYHTVVAHRRKMMAKAECKTITELLAYARNQKIVLE